MCEWTKREYGCGHNSYIVACWCNSYRLHKGRCCVNVTHYEFRNDERCASCRPRQHTPEHAAYLKSIYKDLLLRYPNQNWEAIRVLVEPENED